MKTYRATRRGFIGRRLIEPGQTFEFDGKPGSWMEPVKEAKQEESKADDKKADDKGKAGK